jgi:hypothetical protein
MRGLGPRRSVLLLVKWSGNAGLICETQDSLLNQSRLTPRIGQSELKNGGRIMPSGLGSHVGLQRPANKKIMRIEWTRLLALIP